MIRQLELSGDHYEMGWQHGCQVRDLSAKVLDAVENRLSILDRSETPLQPFLDELLLAWELTARPILEMLKGIADALDFKWDDFFRYTVSTYLLDRARRPLNDEQGCTVWATGKPLTRDGAPILVKNRDYWPDHQELQCLAWARPKLGYRYAYLTSAGSPGVFSSGMNEAGLGVADTHVVSLAIGPGLPRYAVMMDVLERYERVEAAVDYLKSVRHTGNGTLVLADASGDMAVVETGFALSGVIGPKNGFVVSANHFVTRALCDRWLERSRKELHGNSIKRHAWVRKSLKAARGAIDLEWARQLMSSHGDGDALSALCNHPGERQRSVTISSIIFLPQSRRIYLADGMPCQNPYEEYVLG
ncbi:MAG: hypothetical protein JXA78_09625 [Anaerolineales bacterium]|nr:hypothetical protein [Anaerolineales bacterium]